MTNTFGHIEKNVQMTASSRPHRLCEYLGLLPYLVLEHQRTMIAIGRGLEKRGNLLYRMS